LTVTLPRDQWLPAPDRLAGMPRQQRLPLAAVAAMTGLSRMTLYRHGTAAGRVTSGKNTRRVSGCAPQVGSAWWSWCGNEPTGKLGLGGGWFSQGGETPLYDGTLSRRLLRAAMPDAAKISNLADNLRSPFIRIQVSTMY
jgi:hypothetical protein